MLLAESPFSLRKQNVDLCYFIQSNAAHKKVFPPIELNCFRWFKGTHGNISRNRRNSTFTDLERAVLPHPVSH